MEHSLLPHSTPLGESPTYLIAGDFNNDGNVDLVTASSQTISILLGNGDGKPDLAVTNSSDNSVSILLGNGDGTFQAHVSYPGGALPLGITNGDFNGDGKLDLAVTEWFGSSTVAILLGNGDGSF